jgi:pilus assembly protein Flp/PilA
MTQMYAALFTVKAWVEARTGSDRERGAAMVEYGLLIALIAVVVAIAAEALGTGISDLFEEVTADL